MVCPGLKCNRGKSYLIRIMPKSKMGAWSGMNFFAAREVGFPHSLAPNEVWVASDAKDKEEVVIHEVIEVNLMRDGGLGYAKAHRITNNIEADLKVTQ